MTRLINNQGHWQIEIRKSDHKAMAKIIRHNPCTYTSIHETKGIYRISFSEWSYDGPEHASESDYRAILSKITKKPDPDLVIPDKSFPVEFVNGIFATTDPLTATIMREWQRPTELTKTFLEEAGNLANTKHIPFQWKE
jgi:hypothetical protein